MSARVHLINPSELSFGVAVITPRWLYVLAAATGSRWGDPNLIDETLDQVDHVPCSVAAFNQIQGRFHEAQRREAHLAQQQFVGAQANFVFARYRRRFEVRWLPSARLSGGAVAGALLVVLLVAAPTRVGASPRKGSSRATSCCWRRCCSLRSSPRRCTRA